MGGGADSPRMAQNGGGGVPQRRLYFMFIAFLLYNAVSYQTLQWLVYIQLSFTPFKTFTFGIAFILLMVSFLILFYFFLTPRLRRKHFRMTYLQKVSVTNKQVSSHDIYIYIYIYIYVCVCVCVCVCV